MVLHGCCEIVLLQNRTAMVGSFLLRSKLVTRPVRQLGSGKGHSCLSEPLTDGGVERERVKKNEMQDGCYGQNRNMIDFCHGVCEFTREGTASCSQTNCCCQMAEISANIVMLRITLGEISSSRSPRPVIKHIPR